MKDINKCVICGKYTEEAYHCNNPTKQLLDGRRRLSLSKLISYILRHDPKAINLTLTSDGWAKITDLINGIKCFWRNRDKYQWVREEHIIALAKLDPKSRFEVKGDFIRARYGHAKALNVKINYELDLISKILYHGTTSDRLKSILSEGIKPMKRKYVHLSTDIINAYQTALRHKGKPVILVIDCEMLRQMNIKIFIASKVIRLVSFVPPKCIKEVINELSLFKLKT